jgi:hypothetical protein
MTPSDLAVSGVDAPESMLRVYSIENVAVRGSTVMLTVDLSPEEKNADEFSGACNQVIQGYAPRLGEGGKRNRAGRRRAWLVV